MRDERIFKPAKYKVFHFLADADSSEERGNSLCLLSERKCQQIVRKTGVLSKQIKCQVNNKPNKTSLAITLTLFISEN